MKKLLTGLLMLGATSVFAFDFSGEYQLAESESPRGCPSGLTVKAYDDQVFLQSDYKLRKK